MNFLKQRVVVLSRNYSTGLGVIRSLGEAGYPVDLVASVKKRGSSVIASCSKYVEHSYEVLSEKIQGDEGQDIIALLLDYAKEKDGKAVLFPADDFTTSVIDKHRYVLKDHFIMPETKLENMSVTSLMDKSFQSNAAKAAGVLVPAEWKISLRNHIEIPSDMVYPCFVKPLQSFSGHKTEMAACKTKDELLHHLKDMKQFYEDRDVLVQEYLQIDKEYDLSGICHDGKVIIPAIIEKTCISQHERGVTMAGALLPADTLGEMYPRVLEMLKAFRYTGMFDMELNLCGDRLYFNEVNLRSGGPNFSYFLNGVNLPALAVKAMTGEDYSDWNTEIPVYGKSFVYEKVAWEDYIHGFITKKALKNYLKKADFTLLKYANDPKPGAHFARRIRLSAWKHRIKKVIR